MALLGAIILMPEMIDEVIGIVPSGACFYAEAHGAIYDALLAQHEAHRGGDLVTLTQALRDHELLQPVGGVDYLVRLAGETPSGTNAPYYASIVAGTHALRRMIDVSAQNMHDCSRAGTTREEVADTIEACEQRVFDAAEAMVDGGAGGAVSGESVTLGALLDRTIAKAEASEGLTITGVATGFVDLDELTAGLQPGEMAVIAARPSMGKTAIGLNMAEQIAMGGTPVALFSMEMSREAIAQRMLCARAGIDSHRFRTNRMVTAEWSRAHAAAFELGAAPLHIDDTSSLSIAGLRARARRMHRRHKVGCIVIDYLQMMTAAVSRGDGRQQEVSAISRGVKAVARDLGIPVVVLAQLNRAAEQREGHRPRMSDLRESGSIEQDADVIILLHREEYYHVGDASWAFENPDKVGVAELIIAKQRNGPTGIVTLTWDAASTRFRDRAGG